MIRRTLPNAIVFACITLAWPSIAAKGEVATGLNNTGIGMFIIAVAGALLITLLFRASATHVARMVMERIGKYRIRKILNAKSADVLEDFILPGAYGGLTHIDHAMLTSGGILCIQTKHYNGVVFGGPDEPQWTNVDGVQRRKFLNPLIQNEGRESHRVDRRSSVYIGTRIQCHSCKRSRDLHRQVRVRSLQD